jgi:acid phosphatase
MNIFLGHLRDRHRFTNSSGNASVVYLEFGHGTTIDFALTALGLAK